LISVPRSAWSAQADRFLTWGMLVAVVVVALVGLGLLTSIKHPAAGAAAAPVTVLMSQPIDSALPSVELTKRSAESARPCTDAQPANRDGACPPRRAAAPGVAGGPSGH
jgi:hypothetical protein